MKAKPYECIKHRGKVLAIIICAGYSADKTTFFSSPEFPQQLGLRGTGGGYFNGIVLELQT